MPRQCSKVRLRTSAAASAGRFDAVAGQPGRGRVRAARGAMESERTRASLLLAHAMCPSVLAEMQLRGVRVWLWVPAGWRAHAGQRQSLKPSEMLLLGDTPSVALSVPPPPAALVTRDVTVQAEAAAAVIDAVVRANSSVNVQSSTKFNSGKPKLRGPRIFVTRTSQGTAACPVGSSAQAHLELVSDLQEGVSSAAALRPIVLFAPAHDVLGGAR